MPEKITLQRELIKRDEMIHPVELVVLVDYTFTPNIYLNEITDEAGNHVAVTAEEINKIENELWKKAKQ